MSEDDPTPAEQRAAADRIRDAAGYYALLGVSPDASLYQIREVYLGRKFAMRMATPEAQEAGRIAYHVLSDSIRRACYDPAWVRTLGRR